MNRNPGLKLVGGGDRIIDHAHAALVYAARDEASRLGLGVIKVAVSRFRRSESRHLHLRDVNGRKWTVRVSAHHLPRRAPRCHFDLVSRDGVFGRDILLAFLGQVAANQAPWFDPEADYHRPPARVKRRIDRRR